MKSIREMTADTETYQLEIKRLIETDPKAEQVYIKMKAELGCRTAVARVAQER